MARLMIVDDHPVVREGLKTYLRVSGFDVIAEAGDAAEGLAVARDAEPELVLLDLQLPDAGGLALLPQLLTLPKPPKVVVLTSFLDEDYVRDAMRLGASGFLVKHAGPGALLDGVRAALRGEVPLDPGAVRMLAQAKPDPLQTLTPREREVLEQIAQGLSNKAIAQTLAITEKTVKAHVSSIFAKLGVSDRVKAALYAKERHL